MSHDFPDGPDYNPEPLDDDPWDVDTTSAPPEPKPRYCYPECANLANDWCADCWQSGGNPPLRPPAPISGADSPNPTL